MKLPKLAPAWILGLKKFTVKLMAGTVIIWGIYDVIVYFLIGNAATESANTWTLSYEHVWIAFACGLLGGHLFLQMHQPTIFATDDDGSPILIAGDAIRSGQELKIDGYGMIVPK